MNLYEALSENCSTCSHGRSRCGSVIGRRDCRGIGHRRFGYDESQLVRHQRVGNAYGSISTSFRGVSADFCYSTSSTNVATCGTGTIVVPASPSTVGGFATQSETYALSGLSAGTEYFFNLEASATGHTSNYGSALNFTTPKANQTITITSTNPSPVTVGAASYTPSATAPGGTVAITLDGSSSGCSLSAGIVTFTAIGTCVIDFNQSAASSYNAAPQVQQSVIIHGKSQTITVTSTPPSSGTVGGATYTPSATAPGERLRSPSTGRAVVARSRPASSPSPPSAPVSLTSTSRVTPLTPPRPRSRSRSESRPTRPSPSPRRTRRR